MFNLSSAQGARFAEVCTEMSEHIRALGPNPLAPPAGVKPAGTDPDEPGPAEAADG